MTSARLTFTDSFKALQQSQDDKNLRQLIEVLIVFDKTQANLDFSTNYVVYNIKSLLM